MLVAQDKHVAPIKLLTSLYLARYASFRHGVIRRPHWIQWSDGNLQRGARHAPGFPTDDAYSSHDALKQLAQCSTAMPLGASLSFHAWNVIVVLNASNSSLDLTIFPHVVHGRTLHPAFLRLILIYLVDQPIGNAF
jgi:hypothetical protein